MAGHFLLQHKSSDSRLAEAFSPNRPESDLYWKLCKHLSSELIDLAAELLMQCLQLLQVFSSLEQRNKRLTEGQSDLEAVAKRPPVSILPTNTFSQHQAMYTLILYTLRICSN